jgi:alcohol dehydrogenase (cytochrome c)
MIYYDYDAGDQVLLDTIYKGKRVAQLLVEANRNGFIYTWIAAPEYLSAVRFVEKLNWASGIDAKGRPIRTDVKPTPEGANVCPGYMGATNWFSPSYNESTGLLYFMALEQCQTYFSASVPQQFEPGKEFYSTGVQRSPGEKFEKLLLAYNVGTGSIAWRYPQSGPRTSSPRRDTSNSTARRCRSSL